MTSSSQLRFICEKDELGSIYNTTSNLCKNPEGFVLQVPEVPEGPNSLPILAVYSTETLTEPSRPKGPRGTLFMNSLLPSH